VRDKKKHPRKLGFKLALEVHFSNNWSPTLKVCSEEAKSLSDIVYVAIGRDGSYLRVGETGGTLFQRWGPVLMKQIPAGFTKGKYRRHERMFSAKFRSEAAARDVQFWIKPAKKIRLDYLDDTFWASARGAEENYLDRYYRPKLSVELEGRRAARLRSLNDSRTSIPAPKGKVRASSNKR
jgi:hypothetical protein